MKFILPLCLLLSATCAFAAKSARDPVREAEIEQQLARLDATLVDPFHRATVAYDADKFAEVESLLTPIVERIPTFDPALRRLGMTKVMQGQRPQGMALIERAVSAKRSSANLITLAHALAFTGKSGPADQDRALKVLKEARPLPDGDGADVLTMIGQLALQRNQMEDAREAIATLQQRFPELLQTHYLAAYLAAAGEHWNLAVKEIRKAEKLGLDAEAVNRFLNSGVQSHATGWRIAGVTLWTIALWAVGLIALFATGFGLSKATLRQVERSDATISITTGEHRLRRIYRTVLNLAGIYYYFSLPIVFLLVVGLAGAGIYACLQIGRVPIKLMILLLIGAVATVWAMVRSLFLRVKAGDPGRPLTRAEAPGLWELSEDVARELNTRAIEEIRLTVGTDLCVYERGSWREKLENRATRVLVIGVAVLDGFKQEDFRSVLAHEYGHFSNRDTAGGDIALRVQNDMLKFYYAMVEAGQATWLNLGFHFLRAYHFIFRRISHGATRLQEVLADRVAAQAYGAPAFESGLRHVIRRSIAFDAHAHIEIQSAIDSRRPVQNLYQAELPLAASGEAQFNEAMNRETTDDDTHPAPKDRFRLIARLPPTSRPPSTGLVWELFSNREAVVTEMTAAVEKNIAPHRK